MVRHLIRLARLPLAVLVVAAGCTLGAAQAQTSAADAASVFGSLSSDQQQAILQQLGGSSQGNSDAGAARGTTGTRARAGQLNGVNASGRAADARNAEEDALTPAALVRLKPGDTVLVDVSIRREQAAAAGTAGVGAANAVQNTQLPGTAVVPVGATGATASAAAPLVQPGKEIELTPREREDLEKLMTQLRERNPYVLNREGALELPGFDAIALAGLTDEQAGLRVGADRALLKLTVRITHLPLQKSGVAALKPFGYDLFDNPASTFAPVTDVPVPVDYVVGPGDVLEIQLYGNQNRSLRLTVSRDGRINFPQLGPIGVAGKRFSTVQADLQQRVARQMLGVNASVSMGDTRAIQVFVLGEVRTPGAYTVSGLATMTSALFASGGVKAIGSLRNIQLKRQGALVRTLDLYDLLLRGDTANDMKLLPGDVIFIPAVGSTVIADGEVQRPAIYELRGPETAADLVGMAGGLTPQADGSLGSLTRVDEQRRRVVLGVDLGAAAAAKLTLRNGDTLRVPRLRPTLDSGIVLQGHVYRPGNFAWREGLRLSQVIPSVDELKPDADQHYVLIRRELQPDRRISVLSADLAAALRAPGADADVLLQPRDTLTVFDLSTDRERVIAPLMNELKVQGGFDRPTERVSISGRVKVPGDYPLEAGMRVADLIRAGGTLDSAAYGGTAELSRYVIENGQTRRTQVQTIDLGAALRGDPNANVVLQAYDGLYIKEISGWTKQEQVVLKGEVRFPGTYAIQRGETLRSVVERAGGFTELASKEGAVFTREDLKQREQDQLDRLADRMQTDLATMSIMTARANQGNSQQAYAVGQQLIAQLKAAKAVGRLVIDVDTAMRVAPGSTGDIVLRDGDTLMVPKQSQEVTVMGEVQNVTSHLYAKGETRDDYINLSGGLTREADKKHIYVVRANGSVIAESDRWFSSGGEIRAGDTIVAPLNTDRLPQLTLWQSVTQIVYNLAIAAAAVHSF